MYVLCVKMVSHKGNGVRRERETREGSCMEVYFPQPEKQQVFNSCHIPEIKKDSELMSQVVTFKKLA